ncbi:unnamed protein product [Cuscuta europaea]|uniref:Uncharacterized protein n=1 Tax=Cuscuta europaea TaxID=41803 RepID=A0A9P0ZW90_CUSEU|nr:unnamed protein product [Cuscuta europaea]
MGNQVSCRSSVSISGHLIEASCKVLLPGGEIQKLREPIKAAEIMLEHSGHFLVNAGSLVAGRRFSGVAADDDLEFGSVYVMFPMKRLGSVITAADVGMLVRAAAACTEKRVSAGNGTKVSPAEGGVGSPGNDVGRIDLGVEYRRHRLSACRSRKPLLETIAEEPGRTRGS